MIKEDSDLLARQINALHYPEGMEVDVKYLLQLVKDILSVVRSEQLEEKESVMSNEVKAFTSCEEHLAALQKKMEDAASRDDRHNSVISILKELSKFSWDAKAVLVLACFALNHGVWLLAQMHSARSTLKEAKDLDKLYTILRQLGPKKSELDAYYIYSVLIDCFGTRPRMNQLPKPSLTKMFKALIRVAECIIELQELPSADLKENVPKYTTAMEEIPLVVFGIISIVVHCVAVINKFVSNDYEISEADEKELSLYTDKLNKESIQFTDQIGDCIQYTEESKYDQAYQLPIREGSHSNREALEFLLKGGGDQQMENMTDEIIDRFKEKYVLLFVSDQGVSRDEVVKLRDFLTGVICEPTEKSRFGMLCISLYPDRSAIEHLWVQEKSAKIWSMEHNPIKMSKTASYFIKDKWQVRSKTYILVVLDPLGIVLNINAMHMMFIWCAEAFPFTRLRERALWKTKDLNLQFLLGVEETPLQWIEGNYLFVYGGSDIEWIRKFTISARVVARSVGIPLDILSLANPSTNEETATPTQEHVEYFFREPLHGWFFWTRLGSMLTSKMKHQSGGSDTEDDSMTRNLKQLLGYKGERSWALLARGNTIVTHGHGSTILKALDDYDVTKKGVSFDEEFENEHEKVAKAAKICCQVEFPITSSWFPDTMKCPDTNCKREMSRSTVFDCCHPKRREIARL